MSFPILAIDFDDTICDTKNRQKGKMGAPTLGAKEAVTELHKKNHIVIFTTRATNERSINVVAEWLKYFDIPFDDITNIKPDATHFIDNRAVHFQSWAQVMHQLESPNTLKPLRIAQEPIESALKRQTPHTTNYLLKR